MIVLNNVTLKEKTPPMCFNLKVARGERLAIIGASGAGKSTLLNLIAGFEFPDHGEIWLDGVNHTRSAPYARPVSMLFQENNLFPHLTVRQNLALGLKPSLKLTALERTQVEQAAASVGLADYLERLPDSLSGGQKQRVALARCLLRDKPILLLDEPFSALDPLLRAEMLALIEQLCATKQLTLLLVTHQPSELAGKADRIIRVENGKILGSVDVSKMPATEAIFSQGKAKNSRFSHLNKNFSTRHWLKRAPSLRVVLKMAACRFAKLANRTTIRCVLLIACGHFERQRKYF